MTDDELGFVAAINSNPECDTARLVYADWLQERDGPGDVERAEFIRVQIARTKPCPEKPSSPSPIGTMVIMAVPFIGAGRAMDRLDRYKQELNEWTYAKHAYDYLPIRERELFHQLPVTAFPPSLDGFLGDRVPRSLYRRGFIHSITCTAADWLTHADKLAWHPSQTVECPTCLNRSIEGSEKMRRYGGFLCKECSTHHPPGRLPRPCLSTAQPIREVTLTTELWIEVGPPVSGTYARRCRFRGREWHEIDFLANPAVARARIVSNLLEREWPWIKFTFPEIT